MQVGDVSEKHTDPVIEMRNSKIDGKMLRPWARSAAGEGERAPRGGRVAAGCNARDLHSNNCHEVHLKANLQLSGREGLFLEGSGCFSTTYYYLFTNSSCPFVCLKSLYRSLLVLMKFKWFLEGTEILSAILWDSARFRQKFSHCGHILKHTKMSHR